MKILYQFAVWILIILYVFISCKKDKEQVITQPPPPPPPPRMNNAPIAKAGPDISVTLSACAAREPVLLDGGLSSDPDNDPIYYTWRKISGPTGFAIQNSTKVKAYAEVMTGGSSAEFGVELTVRDAGGLDSKDTMLISVKPPTIREYDLDITFTGTFIFFDNESDCYYTPCSYYDRAILQGVGNFLPVGAFNLYISEYTDSPPSSYAISSYISISGPNGVNNINGTSTINLKKIYQQGGGLFSGIFKVESGTASMCKSDVFLTLAPLTITGNVDTTARTATVRIKGKTYF